MKRNILIICLLAVSCMVKASFDTQCNAMYGTYSVIPFNNPLGLKEATELVLTETPLGKPVFKVEKKDNDVFHIGLVNGNKHKIALKTVDNLTKQEEQDFLTEQGIVKCFYNIDKDVKILAVDFSTLDHKKLDMMLQYIPSSWGSIIIDNVDPDNIYKPDKKDKIYTLTKNELKNIKYLFAQSIVITGVMSYTVIIPLNKK